MTVSKQVWRRRAPRLPVDRAGRLSGRLPQPIGVLELSLTGCLVRCGALTGLVLQDGPRCVAYCYYMLDAGRAIVGSLFAAAGFRGQGLEEALLEEVLSEAQGHPTNDRVECQTLFSTATGADGRFARAGFMSRVRHYLVRPLDVPAALPAHRWTLRPLRREDLGPAAHIIHASHR